MVTGHDEGVTGIPRNPLVCWSGRPDSNRRRPAWEAGILPLNYGRSALSNNTPARYFRSSASSRWRRRFAGTVEIGLMVERRSRDVLDRDLADVSKPKCTASALSLCAWSCRFEMIHSEARRSRRPSPRLTASTANPNAVRPSTPILTLLQNIRRRSRWRSHRCSPRPADSTNRRCRSRPSDSSSPSCRHLPPLERFGTSIAPPPSCCAVRDVTIGARLIFSVGCDRSRLSAPSDSAAALVR